MDDERPGELLRALVGRRQASQREDFPGLYHGRYLTPNGHRARCRDLLHAREPLRLRGPSNPGAHAPGPVRADRHAGRWRRARRDPAPARWDPEALAAAEIDEARLFPLRDWTEARRGLRAPWAMRWPALRGVDWPPAVGDGAAGNVGSDCIDPSRVALNVGTSAALRVVTTDPPEPRRGLWRYRLDRRRALLGGATSEGGNVYAWCRQILKLPGDAEVEAALAELPAAGHGLTVLPHWAGQP